MKKWILLTTIPFISLIAITPIIANIKQVTKNPKMVCFANIESNPDSNSYVVAQLVNNSPNGLGLPEFDVNYLQNISNSLRNKYCKEITRDDIKQIIIRNATQLFGNTLGYESIKEKFIDIPESFIVKSYSTWVWTKFELKDVIISSDGKRGIGSFELGLYGFKEDLSTIYIAVIIGFSTLGIILVISLILIFSYNKRKIWKRKRKDSIIVDGELMI